MPNKAYNKLIKVWYSPNKGYKISLPYIPNNSNFTILIKVLIKYTLIKIIYQ